MPIQVELINDNQVVLQTYREPLTTLDLTALRDTMDLGILPSASHEMMIIADLSALKKLPSTIFSTGVGMLSHAHPNTGMIICVSKNGFVQTMARLFTGVLPRQMFKIVASLDDALAEVDNQLQKKQM
jgi:hypothetical protein